MWKTFKEYISLSQLIETSKILCWSAKWAGTDQVMFDSVQISPHESMLSRIHMLLDEADAVVHYNGLRFDIPVLNKEFLLANFGPPAPYKNIDLYRTVKNVFKFTSNKLDHVVQQLDLGKKVETSFDLWIKCMEGDKDAWKHMEEYNKQDILLLEKLYYKMLPWIPNHPNYTLYTNSEEILCPTCGSTHYHCRGYAYTAIGKYQRYQCLACGKWYKDRKNLTYKQTVSV